MTPIKDRIASKSHKNTTVKPFNSAQFVEPRLARSYALPHLINALTSNDPDRVINAVSEDTAVILNQVASTLTVLADAKTTNNSAGLADESDESEALQLMASITALCSNAVMQVDFAHQELKSKGKDHA